MTSSNSRMNTTTDDDYFPSFLTALPKSPSKVSDSAKDKASAASSRLSELSSSWAAKPRVTFAESLSMDKAKKTDADMEDSPFAFGTQDNTYMDRIRVRKRKPHSMVDDFEDDAPPPPTSSLSDPLSVFSADTTDASVIQRVSTYPPASFVTSLQGDDWGYDKQYWVTIYGFPASSKSYILQQFQALGEVIDYISGTGNWLHLRYHTRLQAEKALTYDGKTVAGSVMIGVKRCLPSDLDGVREGPVSSLFVSQSRQNPGSRDLEVDPTETDIMLPPRRGQDICSRVLNYLFKW